MLTKLNIEDTDRFVPSLVPYLDQATEHTSDSLAIPIWKFVAGDRKLSPETVPESLSPAQHTVLLHLFKNFNLWATNVAQNMYHVIGLGNRRADWARVLDVDPGLSAAQIEEFLSQISEKQRCATPDEVKEIRLCSIGTADFLPYLREYPNLEILDFADTALSDSDLKTIAQFTQLRQVRLNNTPVTNAGIASLITLSNLEELYLWGTNVTNTCLESLGQLPKLKYISLSNTGATKEAAQGFMEQNPNCHIIC